MSLDPTLEEMEDFLRQKTSGLLDWSESGTADVMRIAIHYFASEHYCGMFSNLYQAVCTVDYDQKDLEFDDECFDVKLLHDFLIEKYTK